MIPPSPDKQARSLGRVPDRASSASLSRAGSRGTRLSFDLDFSWWDLGPRGGRGASVARPVIRGSQGRPSDSGPLNESRPEWRVPRRYRPDRRGFRRRHRQRRASQRRGGCRWLSLRPAQPCGAGGVNFLFAESKNGLLTFVSTYWPPAAVPEARVKGFGSVGCLSRRFSETGGGEQGGLFNFLGPTSQVGWSGSRPMRLPLASEDPLRQGSAGAGIQTSFHLDVKGCTLTW